MPLEIEVKIKVPNHDAVRTRLKESGATRKGSVVETNIFFDRPDRSLRKADSGLRVRFSKSDARTDALLTFKGPAASTGLRSREAFDLHVTPGDQLIPMLLAMGFEQLMLFEKQRETWSLDGCLIELDTLPILRHFVEVEGPSEDVVTRVQRKIGLSGVTPERASYSKMVSELLNKRGSRELRLGMT
jgi:predicted adenylyl cyclase CyaB